MDCQEFESLLQQSLEERLDPCTVEMRAHADQCVECEEHLRQSTLIHHAVSAWRQALPKPSEGLTARILASLPQSVGQRAASPQLEVRVTPPDRRVSRWQVVAVAVASMAAMWLMFIGSGFRDGRRPNQQLTAIKPWTPTSPVPVPASVAPQADLEGVLASAEGAYSQLATETLEVAQDFALLWPSSQAVSDNGPTPAATPQSSAAGTVDWSDDLAPISESVEDALDFLWRAAPRVEKTAT